MAEIVVAAGLEVEVEVVLAAALAEALEAPVGRVVVTEELEVTAVVVPEEVVVTAVLVAEVVVVTAVETAVVADTVAVLDILVVTARTEVQETVEAPAEPQVLQGRLAPLLPRALKHPHPQMPVTAN